MKCATPRKIRVGNSFTVTVRISVSGEAANFDTSTNRIIEVINIPYGVTQHIEDVTYSADTVSFRVPGDTQNQMGVFTVIVKYIDSNGNYRAWDAPAFNLVPTSCMVDDDSIPVKIEGDITIGPNGGGSEE